jgi:hypothetical protein
MTARTTARRPFLLAVALALSAGCKSRPAPPPARPRPADRSDVPALPDYSLFVAGGRMDYESPPTGYAYAILVEPPARVEVVLRPAAAPPRAPFAKIFWVKDAALRRWPVRWTSEPGNRSVRWRGDGERPLGPGRGELVAVVSPVDDIPDDPDLAWLKSPPKHGRVQRYPVRWR